MKNKHTIRYGRDAENMRPMISEDILISRLNLLVIMAKAYLKSYPVGEFRRKAIRENARCVFHEACLRTLAANSRAGFAHTVSHRPRRDAASNDRMFLQRAQLLAVMVHSFTWKKSTGNFRKKAMAANIEQISEYLADGFQLRDTKILKVA
jgi:hypothetical protein